jgi:acyl-homoserine-lactone acylase
MRLEMLRPFRWSGVHNRWTLKRARGFLTGLNLPLMPRCPSMKPNLALLGLLGALCLASCASLSEPEPARFEATAARVTITRDDWGIAHVRGKTDADAVFGMIYAQAEDDFNRVETNYLTALGRLAEAEGESAIWSDLRQRLFIDPDDLKRRYAASPAPLKRLMDAWADGLNYYLLTHPETRPRIIRRFEPWMTLSFSEGSIGGDIATISLQGLEAFYGVSGAKQTAEADNLLLEEPRGSNGIALAPSVTRDGHALLLINPHTSFYFRSELQMTSEEGLNAYGAATWGQFFIYQGFNEHAGWMHTTSTVDAVDEFAETIVARDGKVFYRHGAETRAVETTPVILRYRTPDGGFAERAFDVRRTVHGPIVRAEAGRWIATSLMHKPVEALTQSFYRTKAPDLPAFLKVSALAANSSNNTLFADDKGNVALLLPQFVPKRNDRFDYTKPVDGADPAADWAGETALDALPSVINPRNGWVYNSNDGPWWAAGANSPVQSAFPRYVDTLGANARTPQALRVLDGHTGFTPQGLVDAAYDPYLPTFAALIPDLVAAYDALPSSDPRKARLADPITALRGWDFKWSATSVPTALAVNWGETAWARVAPDARAGLKTAQDVIAITTSAEKLAALEEVVERLTRDFGSWDVQWGEINRFQRLSSAINASFDDARPSFPVPFTSAQWGSLASFGAQRYANTRKVYGSNGNSFVAVVEFGPRVRARAVSAGGASGDVASRHFNDQIERYAKGDLRNVYFYPDELTGHIERTYRPGELSR